MDCKDCTRRYECYTDGIVVGGKLEFIVETKKVLSKTERRKRKKEVASIILKHRHIPATKVECRCVEDKTPKDRRIAGAALADYLVVYGEEEYIEGFLDRIKFLLLD